MIDGTIDNFTMQAYTFRFGENDYIPYTLRVEDGRVFATGQEYESYTGRFATVTRDRGRFASMSCLPYPDTEKLAFTIETTDERGRAAHVRGWMDYERS